LIILLRFFFKISLYFSFFVFQHISNNVNQLILPDTGCLNKPQHQNYARKNNLESPVFTIEAKGPPHDIRYKATVVVEGKSFESPTVFDTKEEAEQTALQIVDMFQARSVLVISYVILN